MGAMPIPNMNPTGVIGSGSGNTMAGQTSTPFSAFMPTGTGTGGSGNMNMGNAANPNATPSSGNPYTPAGTPSGASPVTGATPQSPTTSMNPGQPAPQPGAPAGTVTGENGQTSTSNNNFNQTQTQQNRTLGELQTYYGEGMGSLIYQYLQSNGGYNSSITQQAVDSQTNAMQQQTQLGANNLQSMLGAEGISGTGLTDSLTNYENQAVTQENAITSQEYYNMWNASQDRELAVLNQAGQTNATGTANQPNWMDYLDIGLETAGAVALA
jgi:hypothetical protein